MLIWLIDNGYNINMTVDLGWLLMRLV